MKILTLKPGETSFTTDIRRQIQQALSQQEVIVYPTDTLYGLGVDARSELAVGKLFQMKKRESSPVSVLLDSKDSLLNMVQGLGEREIRLIQELLPGPLTVICKTQYPFARKLFSHSNTIGFRVPGDSISTSIVKIFGHPITTTSVNPAGLTPASSVADVSRYYKNQLSLMLDIGTIKTSKGSTVVDLTAQPYKIMREGEISRQVIEEYLN